MTLYRDHRGSLVDSMATVREVSSIQDIREHLEQVMHPFPIKVIHIKRYGYDERVGWDNHAVYADGSIMGFTNGALT